MIKTYWDVLYCEEKLFKEAESKCPRQRQYSSSMEHMDFYNKKYKNLYSAGIATQHNLMQKINNK